MVKVKTISRSELDWTKDRSCDVPPVHRNYDPALNPLSSQTEFTRAIRAAKLDRLFAKPFVKSLSGHVDSVKCIGVDYSDLSRLVTGSMDGSLIIWDVNKKKKLVHVAAHANAIEDLTVSMDGVVCWTASRDKVVKLWDMDSKTFHIDPHNNDNNTNANIYNDNNGGMEPLAEYLGDFPFSSIDHAQHGSLFATTSDCLSLWDINRTQPISRFNWGDETLSCARFNKIETHLIACTLADRGIVLYDTRTRAAHSKIIMERCSTCLSWNPMDPNMFVVGSDDCNCYLFDIRVTGRPKSVYQGPIHPITSVDFSPTGKSFSAGALDATVRLWDVHQINKFNSNEMFHTKRMANVLAVKWSPDSQYIFSGSEDAVIRVWKADASKPIRPLRGPEKHQFQYLRSLKEKYQNFIEVRRISNQRNTPKVISRTTQRKKKAVRRETIKEMSRLKTDQLKPLSKRKTQQYLQ